MMSFSCHSRMLYVYFIKVNASASCHAFTAISAIACYSFASCIILSLMTLL
jgi:hypothetical protein